MFVRSVLLGGAAALGASAMLVVPEADIPVDKVETIDDGIVNILEPIALEPVSPEFSYLVMMDCKECPIREVNEEGVVSWTDGKPSILFVDFHVEDNRLMANDHQIFPPVPAVPITVTQYVEGNDEDSGPMNAGYALEIAANPHSHSHDIIEADLLDLRFTILDLEDHPVPVDTVDLTLVITPNGDLHLADGEIKETAPPAEEMSWKNCHGSAKCLQRLVFDRVHGLLSAAKDRVFGMGGKKGCKGMKGMGGSHKDHDKAGKKGGKGDHHKHHDEDDERVEEMQHDAKHPHGPHGHHEDEGFVSFEDLKEGHEKHHGHHGFRPEGMPPFPPPPFGEFEEEFKHKGHHPHGDFNPEAADGIRPPPPPHHHMHGPPHGAFSHTFSRVVRFIVVPAILGVLAGLTASAIGMLVGQAVIFLWQRYRGTKKQEHKAAWEEGAACEKQGLMTETIEYLPEYTEEITETSVSVAKN
ncbi:hypothetical protein N7488_010068 [Penicillium malachiteum]|nr:hypothetical protein N7488_010068 [Penicillium malachiteum]